MKQSFLISRHWTCQVETANLSVALRSGAERGFILHWYGKKTWYKAARLSDVPVRSKMIAMSRKSQIRLNVGSFHSRWKMSGKEACFVFGGRWAIG